MIISKRSPEAVGTTRTTRKRDSCLALVVTALFLTVAPASGNEDDPDAAVETIFVTATRIENPNGNAAQATMVLTANDLELSNPPDIAAALRQIPGLHMVQQGPRGSIASALIRGGEPNFTAVFLDGLKINDPMNTRGGSFDFTTLGLAGIDRVEIVRGPMSTIYGSDALSGVINIVSKAPSTGVGFDLEAGSEDLQSATVFAGLEKETFGLRGSAFSSSDASRSGGTSYEDTGFSGAGYASIGQNSQLSLVLRKVAADSSAFPEDSGGPLLSVLNAKEQRQVDELSYLGKIQSDIGRGIVLVGSIGRYEREDFSESPGIAAGVIDGVPPNSSDVDFDRTVTNVSLRSDITDQLTLVAGIESQKERGHSQGFIDFGVLIPVEYSLSRDTQSQFVELQHRQNRSLFQASLRNDDATALASEVTAQVGWTIFGRDQENLIRMNWGQGFKAPSFFALGHPLVGNPDLRPESSESIEIGFARSLFNGLSRFAATAFYADYKNLVDFDPDQFTNVNRGQVISRGLELSLVTNPLANLEVEAHMTHMRAEILRSESRLRNRPDLRAGIRVNWQASQRVSVYASLLYVDEFWEVSIPTGGMFLDAYTTVDVSTRLKLSDKLSLRLAVDNALDESYQQTVGVPARGSRIRLGINYSNQ